MCSESGSQLELFEREMIATATYDSTIWRDVILQVQMTGEHLFCPSVLCCVLTLLSVVRLWKALC